MTPRTDRIRIVLELNKRIENGDACSGHVMALLNHAEKLEEQLEEALADLEERRASFELQWKASQRAIKMWQAAHPGNDLVWPDTAKLDVWLMEQLCEIRAALFPDLVPTKDGIMVSYDACDNISGVIVDCEHSGFDSVCLQTLKRVESQLARAKAVVYQLNKK